MNECTDESPFLRGLTDWQKISKYSGSRIQGSEPEGKREGLFCLEGSEEALLRGDN